MAIIKGRVWKFGDDIDTDRIIPARYLNTSDPEKLAEHCMEDADPEFPEKVQEGDIIVAGKNFGSGSSREHAPISIKAAGVAAIIAKSFARIFYRNSFNIGLPILEAPEAVEGTEEGDIIEIDTKKGTIINTRTGITYKANPIPPFMEELLEAGGLMEYIKRKYNLGEE